MKTIWIWRPKEDWRPKSLHWIPNISGNLLCSDAAAGFAVGLVAMPIAIALGIASGLTPQAGLYAAIFGGFVVSVTGGTNAQISGPCGAFVVVVGDIFAKYGLPGLQTVTLMAGLILVLLGFTRLGAAIRFFPRPIVVGLANGIAVLIASKQIGDLLGLRLENAPAAFLPLMSSVMTHLGSLNASTSALAGLSLAVILFMPRFIRRVPGVSVALVFGACATAFLGLPIETIGTRFGGIPIGLPVPVLPDIRVSLMQSLLMPAFAIAILVALESLLSAVVAESMDGSYHNSSVELVGEGIANLLMPVVGGVPVAGAIVRTARNSMLGARSPIAGIAHSLTIVAFLYLGTPLLKSIPLASLAAMMLVVAWNMSLWREVRAVVRMDKWQNIAWLTTFASTVLLDLTEAVGLALILAVLLYLRRESGSEIGHHAHGSFGEHRPLPFATILQAGQCSDVNLSELPAILILRIGETGELDEPGLEELVTFCQKVRDSGRALILCGTLAQGRTGPSHSRNMDCVGRKNIQPNIPATLSRAQQIHDRFLGMGETMARDLKNTPI